MCDVRCTRIFNKIYFNFVIAIKKYVHIIRSNNTYYFYRLRLGKLFLSNKWIGIHCNYTPKEKEARELQTPARMTV
jgi:hypothetical protein